MTNARSHLDCEALIKLDILDFSPLLIESTLKRRELRACKHRSLLGREASMREPQIAGWVCFLDMIAKAKYA